MTKLPDPFGKYKIARLLGAGAMGAVWLAEDTTLKRRVALKVPHYLSDEGLVRFHREAQHAAALEHRNICHIYEIGEFNGSHYLAMAYIEGRPLSQLIEPGVPWDVARAVALVCRVCDAVHFAHETQIIHRDLKPANIMLDRFGEPVVMDFGLARREGDPRLIGSTGALGTPHYMPAEQVLGETENIGPRSDLYSIGVVLYELLTGRTPYTGDSNAVMYAIVNTPLPSPATHRPDLDATLNAICRIALACRPDDRHTSVAEFATALRRLPERLGGEGEATQVFRTMVGPEPPREERPTAPLAVRVAIVSCDIVGHSQISGLEAQLRQLHGVNSLIRSVLEREGEGTFWASRGDGGHVLIGSAKWRESALALIRELHAWSVQTAIPLRIVAHHGQLAYFQGADGRVETVGDGINYIGRLINYAGAGQVVVSEQFVEEFGPAVEHGVRFHDSEVVSPKYFGRRKVYLLSQDGAFTSAWDRPDDRTQMRAAVEKNQGWETIYRAKRLLQVSSCDAEAERALRGIPAGLLQYHDHTTGILEPNPILGGVDGDLRVHLVKAAQLVEREDGDHLCELGDPGDSLFIILTGQVEVIRPPGRIGRGPIFREQGDLIGELAFLLSRPRTAAMRCRGRTALLSLSFCEVEPRLGQLERWVDLRILKYMATSAQYLAAGPNAPLPEDTRPWERLLQGASRFSWAADAGSQHLSLSDKRFSGDGVYVLARGRLHGADLPDLQLCGDSFPILHAAIPGRFVTPEQDFVVESRATVIRIGIEELQSFGAATFDRVTDAVRRAVAEQRRYDVFLAAGPRSDTAAERWREALQQAKLSVYPDEGGPLAPSRPREAALADALVLVVLLNEGEERAGWLKSLLDFRLGCFDAEHANAIAVLLGNAPSGTMNVALRVVEAEGREAEAMRQILSAVQSVRLGLRPPPFSTVKRPRPRFVP